MDKPKKIWQIDVFEDGSYWCEHVGDYQANKVEKRILITVAEFVKRGAKELIP